MRPCQELYQEAIDAWGAEAQVDMLIEECGELIAAINKNRRNIPHRMVREYCNRCRAEIDFAQAAADVRIPIGIEAQS